MNAVVYFECLNLNIHKYTLRFHPTCKIWNAASRYKDFMVPFSTCRVVDFLLILFFILNHNCLFLFFSPPTHLFCVAFRWPQTSPVLPPSFCLCIFVCVLISLSHSHNRYAVLCALALHLCWNVHYSCHFKNWHTEFHGSVLDFDFFFFLFSFSCYLKEILLIDKYYLLTQSALFFTMSSCKLTLPLLKHVARISLLFMMLHWMGKINTHMSFLQGPS